MAVLVAKTGNDGTKAYENWDEGSKSAEGIVIERVKVSRLRADAESCRRRCVETRLQRVRIKLFSPNAGLFWPTQPARGTDHSGDRSASARTGSAHSIYQAGHKNKCVNGAGNTNARDCDVGLHCSACALRRMLFLQIYAVFITLYVCRCETCIIPV